MPVITRTVRPADGEIRLDRWFHRHFPMLTQGALQKMLRTGQIRVDGKRAEANTRLLPGQAVRVVQRRAVPVRHHHESAPQSRRKRGGQKLRPGAQTVGHMGQTRCHGPGLSQPVRRGGKIQRHGYPPLRSDEKNATL